MQLPPANAQSSTTTVSGKRNRVQLRHLLIDVDFFEKPKIIALAEDLGQLEALLLVRTYAAMSKATNAEIEPSVIKHLARIVGVQSPERFTEYCIEHGILCRNAETGALTNSRVAEDQEKLAHAQEVARKRQQKFRMSRVTNALPTRLPDTELLTISNIDLDPIDPRDQARAEGVSAKPERAPLVYLADTEIDCAVGEYIRAKLEPPRAWVEEGIKRLSSWYLKNPGKYRGGRFAYNDLIGWAKDKCVELRTQGLRMVSAQASADKARGKTGAPSVARTAPPRGFEIAKE